MSVSCSKSSSDSLLPAEISRKLLYQESNAFLIGFLLSSRFYLPNSTPGGLAHISGLPSSWFKLLSLPGMPLPVPVLGKYLLSKEVSSGKAPPPRPQKPVLIPGQTSVLQGGTRAGYVCVQRALGGGDLGTHGEAPPHPEHRRRHLILLPGGDIAQLLAGEPLGAGDGVSRAPAKRSATCWRLVGSESR